MEGGLDVAVAKRGGKVGGGVWDSILGINTSDKELSEIFRQGKHLVVGDGRKVRFWHDVWLKDGVMKELFPRLFMLSSDKEETGTKISVSVPKISVFSVPPNWRDWGTGD
ncbi:hypothetical protein PIB30_087595 [Stylosanthes scabra]|uniref:Uncharacterized protein n=1 Tax=Stylosanthes scabra TaxID=79078 RepID=A0ABU6USD0_9FABA|nr:hypothetical protein [Stylosanthes scabra]